MNREDKVTSLELAKQIAEEHKRLDIEPPESEWWWMVTKDFEQLDSAYYSSYYQKKDFVGKFPAYDTAELVGAIIACDHDRTTMERYPLKEINPKELGEHYLWLLQNGYIN